MLLHPKFSTLVFTDTTIKVATNQITSKGFRVSFQAQKTLPTNTVFNGRIINDASFREAVKSLYLENSKKIKVKKLLIGLNEPEVFITTLNLEKKEKNPRQALEQALEQKAPFDLKEETLNFKKLTEYRYQVAAVKTSDLLILSEIFSGSGFSIHGFVPIPLVFPKLVGEKGEPYLFISSEEELIFSLITDNSIVFTSSLKLENKLAQAGDQITKAIEDLLRLSREKIPQNSLKKVIIYGKEAEFLKTFFESQGFIAEILLPFDKFSGQTTYTLSDFSRCLALSITDNSTITFQPLQLKKNLELSQETKATNKNSAFLYFFLSLLVILFFASLLFWSEIKIFFQAIEY